MKTLVVKKPWGQFEQFTHGEPTTVKIISVNLDGSLSLQSHEKRSEFWKILSGDPRITVGDQVIDAHPGGEFFELAKEKHRIAAGDAPAVILEIAFGDFEEGDVVRLQDKYGRA